MQVVELGFVFLVTTRLLHMAARTHFLEGQLWGELEQIWYHLSHFSCPDSHWAFQTGLYALTL